MHFHVILGVAPIAQRIHIAQIEAVLEVQLDARERPRDLARDEGLAAQWRLMVEQDAVASVHPVRLAVIHGNPVGVHFRDCVWAAWIERRGFLLRCFLHQAIQFRSRRLVKAGFLFQSEDAYRFEDAQGAYAVRIRRVLRCFETDRDMTHRREVVNFVRLHLLDDADQVGGIGQVTVMEHEMLVVDVRILVQMVDTVRIEQRRPALDAVDFVAFF